jgi:hypothetical protein
MREANYSSLRHLRTSYKCTLDFSGTDSVAGGVDDVINTTGNPVVTVRVTTTAITGKIISWIRTCVYI